MNATIADLCRTIEFEPELSALRHDRDVERLGLPVDATENEIQEALERNARLRQGVG